MEQHELKDLTIELFQRCCEYGRFPRRHRHQAYLRSGERTRATSSNGANALKANHRSADQGAYWDYETIHAEQMGWPVPVWSRKSQTDACFERMTDLFIDADPNAGTKAA